MGCDQVRELAPELALGIAAGEERDAALRHLTGCRACRQLVSELSAVGDELLLLAPAHEPPAGFESRVLAATGMAPRRRRRPRWVPQWISRWVARARRPIPRARRWALVAAAGVLVAALGAGSVLAATASDRRLADGYRAVLSAGQGSFFTAAPLRGSQGRVGTVYGYQGRPSWVMVTLQPSIRERGRFQVGVVTRDGRYLAVGNAVLGGASGAWGGQLPVDLEAVHELRFVGADGRPVLTATLDAANPWK
jgi:hypothetical protein